MRARAGLRRSSRCLESSLSAGPGLAQVQSAVQAAAAARLGLGPHAAGFVYGGRGGPRPVWSGGAVQEPPHFFPMRPPPPTAMPPYHLPAFPHYNNTAFPNGAHTHGPVRSDMQNMQNWEHLHMQNWEHPLIRGPQASFHPYPPPPRTHLHPNVPPHGHRLPSPSLPPPPIHSAPHSRRAQEGSLAPGFGGGGNARGLGGHEYRGS